MAVDAAIPGIAIDGHLSKTGKRRKTAIDARTTRHVGYDCKFACNNDPLRGGFRFQT